MNNRTYKILGGLAAGVLMTVTANVISRKTTGKNLVTSEQVKGLANTVKDSVKDVKARAQNLKLAS